MKKNIVIALLLIVSIGSIGYITYDEFIREEKAIYQECNKEEICDECICDNECDNYDDESIIIESNKVYDKDGKVYKLDVYEVNNIQTENIDLNGKKIKIENKNDELYVNSKKVEYAMRLYVTNNYILAGSVGQLGTQFQYSIDENGNITKLSTGEFQAVNIYLNSTGNITAIGSNFCGLECYHEKIVSFGYNNGKLMIATTK